MAVKYIFEGYYRSGTTAIWENLKINNPNYKVFYEPFHPALKEKILNQKGKDDLHKKELWDEYHVLVKNKEFLKEIEGLKNNNDFLSSSLENYFSFFKDDSIMQTNRLSFSLKRIKEIDKDIKVVLIVRNPLDIANSLYKYKFKRSKNLSINKLYYLKNGYPIYNSVFNIINRIEYSYHLYGFPKQWKDKRFREYTYNNFNYLVALSWLCSNKSAVDSKEFDKILVYEDLVNAQGIEKYQGLKINLDSIQSNYCDKNIYKYCFKLFKAMDLDDDYKIVYETIF